MKRMTVKSNLRRERMPEWLLFILDITLDGLSKAAPLDGTYEEFEYIQWAVRSDLELLKVKKQYHSRSGLRRGRNGSLHQAERTDTCLGLYQINESTT